MFIIEIILTSIALAMDAFSVSICKGLGMKKLNYVQALIIAAFFGGFQALMPVIGFVFVKSFENTDEFQYFISANAGLVAFILLVFLGAKMLWDVHKDKSKEDVDRAKAAATDKKKDDKLNYVELLFLALATSIDALMTGFAYGVMQVDMIMCISFIGIITFVLSFIGVFIGYFFGARWEKPASITGGVILILLGFRFLAKYFGIF